METLPSDSDYIIIGGGLAGCTLASRLYEGNPSLKVLIIEAGVDPTGHPLASAPLACFDAHGSDLDWAYQTVPQRHLENRLCYNPAGKPLSGGTATNYGTWTRGNAADYDHWADTVGDKRWSYAGMLPYFRKTEHCHDAAADPNQHGFEGAVHNVSISGSSPNRKYPLKDQLRTAWAKVGSEWIPDGNNGSPLGLSEMRENWRDGKRQLASHAYSLLGVQVLTQTLVQRVIIEDQDDAKVATGVQLRDGHIIHANMEVIISAGTYRTPQILMLSGIGAAADLCHHGIPVVIDTPEVGRNFFDHTALWQWWKLRQPERGLSMGTPLWKDPAYQIGKPMDWIIFAQTPREDIEASLAIDGVDHEDSACYLLHPQKCHSEILPIYVPAGAAGAGLNIPIDGSHITTGTIGIMPTSRGTITIASANAEDPPVIDPNYYATEVDRAHMRAGIRQVVRVMQDTPEGRAMVNCEVSPPNLPTLTSKSSDAEIDERVRKVGRAFWHPMGSASMGKVVGTDLRVYGVNRLRVVDASVVPVSIAAHSQVCVYATAEQAADIILGKV